MVDVGLYEPMLRMLDELIPVYAATGYVRERIGSGTEYVVPHNHYRARDGAGWRSPAPTTGCSSGWPAAMGRPELAAEFPTMAARLERRDASSTGWSQAWVAEARRPRGAGPARRRRGAVRPGGQRARPLRGSSDAGAREHRARCRARSAACSPWSGIVPRLTASPGRVESTGPVAVGAHNEEIYCGRLGLSRDDLRALAARGIV